MELAQLLKSNEYKKMKVIYEKEYFKLFGKYCKISNSKGIQEKTPTEMGEKFKNKKVNITVIEDTQTKNGVTVSTRKNISKSFYDVWSQDSTIPEYDDIVFECDNNKVCKTDYNMFDGFNQFNELEKKEILIEPIFEHMRSLVNYNEKMFEYLLSWVAHIVQKPAELPDTAIIMISQEGAGKDLFAELLESTINEKYFGVTEKLDQVCGKFNSTLGGKLLYVINETNPTESSQRKENIKAMITAKKLQLEEKYKTPIKCRNFCRFMFFSNRVLAFPLEEGSRRPVIIEASDKYLPNKYGKKENIKHFTKLSKLFKDRDAQYSFLRYLQARDITKFNPREYEKSRLHKELERGSIDPLILYMYEYISSCKKQKEIKIKTSEMLDTYNNYLEKSYYQFKVQPKKLIADMTYLLQIRVTKQSTNYFMIDVVKVKNLLRDKYNLYFDNEISKDNDFDDSFDKNENDYKEKNYKEKNSKLKIENRNLIKEIELLKKEFELLKGTTKTNSKNIEEEEINNEVIDELKNICENDNKKIEKLKNNKNQLSDEYINDELDDIENYYELNNNDSIKYNNEYDFGEIKQISKVEVKKQIKDKKKTNIKDKIKKNQRFTDEQIELNLKILDNREAISIDDDLEDIMKLF